MPRKPSFLAVTAAALVFVLFSGGAPATAIQDTTSEKVLRIQWGALPNTVDPQRVASVEDLGVAGLGWEGLTRIDDQMDTVPAAAESWKFSPDGLTLTFQLRDGLTYSDGSPLTAERFRYAIERTCDPQTESPFASFIFEIDGCEAFFTSVESDQAAGVTDASAYIQARTNLGVSAVDDLTLQIRLREPAAYFPSVASLAVFFPAKQELIEAGGTNWWQNPANLIGNGPFQITNLRTDTNPSSPTVFTANDRYWGGRPTLDRIEYVRNEDWRTRADVKAAYERGELDIAWLVEQPASPLASEQVFTPRAATQYLGFNLLREPFTDAKVREAFAYAFDRETYCREIVYSLCIPTHSLIPPGVPGYTASDAYAFDPEKARQALAASSYGGPEGLPEIIWFYVPDDGQQSPRSQRYANWLAQQYRTILGVVISLVPITADESSALYRLPLAEKPQLMFWTWYQDYPDPQDWLSIAWTCDSPWNANQSGYCHPDFDSLIARADAELDPAARSALYQEAERILLADAPAIFLYNLKTGVLVKPYVTGYAVTPMDLWPGWTTPLTITVERPEAGSS